MVGVACWVRGAVVGSCVTTALMLGWAGHNAEVLWAAMWAPAGRAHRRSPDSIRGLGRLRTAETRSRPYVKFSFFEVR